MFPVDGFMLVGGFLLLLGIASGKFSARIGMPVLVLFLGLGMVAGSEGIGGIFFEDYGLAHGLGTAALAVILFDGGLRTPLASIRAAWKPALALSTVGVLVTSVITGWAASWFLEIPLMLGVLLGSIVGSTDAAAVFSVLRSSGLSIRARLAATLEIESGSNDPMAIFLTIGLLQVLLGRAEMGIDLAWLFVMQFAVGSAVGMGAGRFTTWLVNRVNLDAAGLYPVLVTACGILAYGVAASLGGSGFLAVYLAGIVIGNSRIVFQRGIFHFHDAAAWLAQIALFVMLGLLVYPSRIVAVAEYGVLIALALIFIARPVAVALSLLPFRFSVREALFLSWVGLKGAVPITLATFPFMMGLEQAHVLFNVVFFVVLVSAVTQGWTLPFVARRLGLIVPSKPEPPVTLEINALRRLDGGIVEFRLTPDARAAGRLLRELPLPENVVVALLVREAEMIPPRGTTRLTPGDHVFVVLHRALVPLVARVFGPPGEEPALPPVEAPFSGGTRAGAMEAFYGIRLGAPADRTLDELVRAAAAPGVPASDAHVTLGEAVLRVQEVEHGVVEQVAVSFGGEIPEGRIRAP